CDFVQRTYPGAWRSAGNRSPTPISDGRRLYPTPVQGPGGSIVEPVTHIGTVTCRAVGDRALGDDPDRVRTSGAGPARPGIPGSSGQSGKTMALRLRVINSSRNLLARDRQTMEFAACGGTIGRSLDN